jgi:hypothetical protein
MKLKMKVVINKKSKVIIDVILTIYIYWKIQWNKKKRNPKHSPPKKRGSENTKHLGNE